MSAPAAADLGGSADERIRSVSPDAAEDEAAPAAERLPADTDRPANFFVQQGPVEEPACDEATRADPERWRACIAELFDADRAVEALHEISLYRRSFPDEPPPAPAK